MRPTASAPDGAAATIAALPPHGRTAVLVVLAVVGLVCVSAALVGLVSLLSVPRRRHGAARSTFYLAAMPTPLAAPGRHRHRRRSAVVRWTAWPNPLSARDEPVDGAARGPVRPVAVPHVANPAGREVTPDRSRVRAQERARRRAEQRAQRVAQQRARRRRRALDRVADVAVDLTGTSESQAPGASPPVAGARPAARTAPVRRPAPRPAKAGTTAAFAAAAGPAEVLTRLAETALTTASAGAGAVVLRLPDGLRVAAVADAGWPVVEADGERRRGCDPEAAASAVGWWRRLVEAVDAGRVDTRAGKGWARGGPPPWAGGQSRRGAVADGEGQPRSLLACPVRVGARTVGALLLARDVGASFTAAEAAATAALVDAAEEALRRCRGPVVEGEEPGSRAELLAGLQALLPGAALPGWAPVVVVVRVAGAEATAGEPSSGEPSSGEPTAPEEPSSRAAEDAPAVPLVGTLAQALRQVMREEDRIYRWGPRELVLVCPDLPRSRRVAVLARLRRCVTTVVAEASSPPAAIGFGWAPATSGSAVKVLARARRAAALAMPAGSGGAPAHASAPTGVPAPRISPDRRPVAARRPAGG